MLVSEQFMTCFVMVYGILEKMVDQRHKKPQKASLLGVKKRVVVVRVKGVWLIAE